jgi:hypothetical protein
VALTSHLLHRLRLPILNFIILLLSFHAFGAETIRGELCLPPDIEAMERAGLVVHPDAGMWTTFRFQGQELPLLSDESHSPEFLVERQKQWRRTFGSSLQRLCRPAEVVGSIGTRTLYSMRTGQQPTRGVIAKEVRLLTTGPQSPNTESPSSVRDRLDQVSVIAERNQQILNRLRALPREHCCDRSDPCQEMFSQGGGLTEVNVKLEGSSFVVLPLKAHRHSSTGAYETAWLDPGHGSPANGEKMRVVERILTSTDSAYE